MTDKQLSARAQLRAWAREEVDEQSSISLPDLTERALAFVQEDPKRLALFLKEMLRSSIYAELREFLGGRLSLIALGDTMVTAAESKRRGKSWAEKFLKETAHVKDRFIVIETMTASDLITAAREHEALAASGLERAKLFRKLAEGLKGSQTVGEAYTADKIEAIRQALTFKKGRAA